MGVTMSNIIKLLLIWALPATALAGTTYKGTTLNHRNCYLKVVSETAKQIKVKVSQDSPNPKFSCAATKGEFTANKSTLMFLGIASGGERLMVVPNLEKPGYQAYMVTCNNEITTCKDIKKE